MANIGNSATIPIQIVSLSLKSVLPLSVTYGGASTNFFDLFVNLDPPESMGSMTLTRTGPDFGTFTSILPVNSLLEFTNENPLGPAAVAPIHRSDTFTSSNGTFLVTPEPNYLLLEVGLLGLCAYAAKRRRPPQTE
jgi:hypothetical protein